jgi:hypothetical protein
VDEAQNLEPSVLETVRLLSDFETPKAKLLQIILAGQPELAGKLASPSLSQLRQRISIVNRIEPLPSWEIKNYVEHRLKVAGYEGPALFTQEALDEIARFTDGIPRNVNNFCFNALSLACALRKKMVDLDVVHEVMSDLDIAKLMTAEVPTAPTNGNSHPPAPKNGTTPPPVASPVTPEGLSPTAAKAYMQQFVSKLKKEKPVPSRGADVD